MLNPKQAWEKIAERIGPRPPSRVPRREALGAVLAEDLSATVDMPPADVSAMDGYACAGPIPLGEPVPVMTTVAAGSPSDVELRLGTVAKIMTGAVVPAGADRVVPVELTEHQDAATVVFREDVPEGGHVRRGGEVVRRGTTLLGAGTLLTPGAVSLLASHGYGEVGVVSRPEVAVLTTGDEVVEPDEEPGPGQLRDSNSAFLVAAGTSLGLGFRRLGIASDDLQDLRAKISQGMKAEVFLLTGGVSMGDFDLVEDVLAEAGCESIFDAVAIQPGKPLVAALHDGGWVFGLPGNPASVMVTYSLFVRPLLRRLMGFHDAFWHGALAAELAAPLPGAKGRDRFLPASIAFHGGRILATPHPPAGSHDTVAYARGTALVRILPHAGPAEAGEPCEVLPLVNWCEP